MNKKHLRGFLALLSWVCMGSMLISCGGDDDTISVVDSSNQTNNSSSTQIIVSPTAELLGTVNSTTTVTISVSSNSMWTVSGVPEWLSLNKSGVGTSAVLITATQENFSDMEREANLVFTLADGSASATGKVSQKGVLAANCRVSLGETIVTWDGFAADMTFDRNCIGYRELWRSTTELAGKTERDIYNLLMMQEEYDKKTDYTFSTDFYISGTEIVYCVAAYGTETNADGSHKYGPMTMVRVVLPEMTYESTMNLTLSYTSSSWNINAARIGSYGQRCDDYYYYAVEGSGANEVNFMFNLNSAIVAYLIKENIKEQGPNFHYKNGPQPISFDRRSDTFFCATWGKNRDTGKFSTLLSRQYKDLSSNNSASGMMKSDVLAAKGRELKEAYPCVADLRKLGTVVRSQEPIYIK